MLLYFLISRILDPNSKINISDQTHARHIEYDPDFKESPHPHEVASVPPMWIRLHRFRFSDIFLLNTNATLYNIWYGTDSFVGPPHRHAAVADCKLEAGRVSQRFHDRFWYVAVPGVVLLVSRNPHRELCRPLGPPHGI